MVVVFGVAKICNSIRSLASLATVQGPFALISLACFTGPLFMILLIDTDTNHLRTHLWAYQNPSGEILVVNQYEGTTEGFEHCSIKLWIGFAKAGIDQEYLVGSQPNSRQDWISWLVV